MPKLQCLQLVPARRASLGISGSEGLMESSDLGSK